MGLVPTEELLKHPCILALYQTLVDEANCHLPYWSTVKHFQLVSATLTAENGMLALTGEVRRAKVVEVFAKEINALYGEADDVKTQRPGDREMGNIDEHSVYSCPTTSRASCPAYAQSLNSSLTA
jgi:long-chain acyl-CoA synthetase